MKQTKPEPSDYTPFCRYCSSKLYNLLDDKKCKLQEDAKYGRAVTYTKGDKIECGILKDLVVDLDLVFKN